MTQKSAKSVRQGVTSGKAIGRKKFARISSVEGIVLSRDASGRLQDFDQDALDAPDRRTAIIRSYSIPFETSKNQFW